MMNEHVPGVPYGSFCYGRIPAPGSGFQTVAEVTAYLEKKYGEDWIASMAEWDELQRRQYCRYLKTSEHGFVECAHLKRRALIVSSEEAREKAVRHGRGDQRLVSSAWAQHPDSMSVGGSRTAHDFTTKEPRPGLRATPTERSPGERRGR